MTSRDRLNKHRKWSLLVIYSCFPIFIAAAIPAILKESNTPNIPLMIIGWLVAIGGWAYMMFGGKCLHCNECLGAMFSSRLPGPIFKISKNLHFCPCCGKSLDEEPAKGSEETNQFKEL